jgi:hypothetical protein
VATRIVTFSPTANTSGRITTAGGVQTPTSGLDNVLMRNRVVAPVQESRGFLQYDTSQILPSATVTKVEFRHTNTLMTSDASSVLGLAIDMGSFVGDALDGTAEEWDGPTRVQELTDLYTGVWIDLEAPSLVVRGGNTDLRLSDCGTTVEEISVQFRGSSCKLRVTFNTQDESITTAPGGCTLSDIVSQVALGLVTLE